MTSAHIPAPETSSGADQTSQESASSAEAYESLHVHSVYDAIAPHFSSTRHKAWPRVASFLLSQQPGSVGLDVGCGNGKYLPVNPHVHVLGSDRSAALVGLARKEGRAGVVREGVEEQKESSQAERVEGKGRAGADVLVADSLSLPHRASSADFVICIAVIHHLSTRERRQDAIRKLLECVRGDGKGTVLVYVWALEQSSSRRGWDENDKQDTLVPWVLRAKRDKPRPKGKTGGQKGDGDGGGNGDQPEEQQPVPDKTYQRYYHLYRKGELEEDVVASGGTVLEAGYEKDNWWVVCSKQ